MGTWGTLGTGLQNRLGRDASCDHEVGGWPAQVAAMNSLWIGLWRSRDGVIATPRWKNCGYEVVTIATTRVSKIAWLISCWNRPAIYWSIVRSFHGSGKCLPRMRKCITFVENSVRCCWLFKSMMFLKANLHSRQEEGTSFNSLGNYPDMTSISTKGKGRIVLTRHAKVRYR